MSTVAQKGAPIQRACSMASTSCAASLREGGATSWVCSEPLALLARRASLTHCPPHRTPL
eukprot:15338601-Alexandrium_andersonii.AAC.1